MITRVELKVVQGKEGNAVYLHGIRIAGPRFWSGPTDIVQTWRVEVSDLEHAIPGLKYEPPGEEGV